MFVVLPRGCIINHAKHDQKTHGRRGFSRTERVVDKESAAFGGRAPEPRELRKVWHQSSPEAALSIIEDGEFKPALDVSEDLAEVYADTNDGGEYTYLGLSREASGFAAVSQGVQFRLNLTDDSPRRTVVQPDQEGGIALVHGRVSLNNVQAVITDDARVKKAWENWKRKQR